MMRSILLVAALMSAPVGAAELTIRITSSGQPVGDAAVSLTPVSGLITPAAREAVMDQVESEFTPRVLVVPVGSRVRFPNSDLTRHQVYSFSPAKRFELPLYSGTPPAPVQFDSPGIVTLGCNIHDWMKGYIVVTDSPYAGLTDSNGGLTLTAPPGNYLLHVWHERLASPLAAQTVRVTDAALPRVELALNLTPPPPPRGTDRLRALQERFRTQPKPDP